MILLRILKNSRAGGIIGVFLLALGLMIISLVNYEASAAPQAMPLYALLFGKIHTLPLLDTLLTLVLIIALAYLLVRVSVRFVLLNSRSFMPAAFMVLTYLALPQARHLSPALLGSVFFMLSFAMLFDTVDDRPDTLRIFNACIIFALGCLFYLKLIWFLPLVWLAMMTLRTLNWRELFYSLMALGLMFLFLFTWYWGVKGDPAMLGTILRENLTFGEWAAPVHFSAYIYYGLVLVLVVVASVYMIQRFPTRKTVVQNIYQVLFFMFVAGGLFFVFISGISTSAIIYMAMPASYVLANFFHRPANHWSLELALWLLLGGLVYVQFTV
jgi:hypothetical protein